MTLQSRAGVESGDSSNSGNSFKAVVLAAGQEAVKLLKMLVSECSLRSDTPKIKAKIARIEKIFDKHAARLDSIR